MLTSADLDEAVKAGIITEKQATQVESLLTERRAARHAHALHDERFVFMKNFNEFFIALGVVLLGVGLWVAAGASPYVGTAFPVFFVAVMWGLAEYLTLRVRLTLPSIVIATFMVMTMPLLLLHRAIPAPVILLDIPAHNEPLLIATVWAMAVALGFYLRFRLPFALLLIVGGSVATLVALFETLTDDPSQLATYTIFLVAGIAALTAGQWYDMSDRERLTRRSDCAFWLTLIAAPLIVHPVVSLISLGGEMTVGTSILTIAVVAFFALIALIIDRRAFLVSSLAYLGWAMIFAVTRLGGEQNALWITLLLLGASVIVLGVGWQKARRAVMQFVPRSVAGYLPVVKA